MSSRDGTPCLGLNRDAGDVVCDGVVEFSGKLFTLAGLRLVDITGADPGAIADRSTQCGGEHEESVGTDR